MLTGAHCVNPAQINVTASDRSEAEQPLCQTQRAVFDVTAVGLELGPGGL